jgi:hypothetical protein
MDYYFGLHNHEQHCTLSSPYDSLRCSEQTLIADSILRSASATAAATTAIASRPELVAGGVAWSFLATVPEIRNFYTRECYLPLEFRNLMDDWPTKQIHNMESRKLLHQREEWMQLFVIQLERRAQEKGVCTVEFANQIHRWGLYSLQNLHNVFSNIEKAFRMEVHIWQQAITSQTPMIKAADPWRFQPLVIQQQQPQSKRVPKLLGPALQWKPVFDSDSTPTSEDEAPSPPAPAAPMLVSS